MKTAKQAPLACRRYLFWGLLMASSWFAVPDTAGQHLPQVTDILAADPQRLRLPPDSVRSALGAQMRVHGLPLRAEVFQTSVSLRQTADLIARQAPVLPSLSVLPGALLLAWQSGSEHWLVRLTQIDETLTRGVVSVLTLADGDHAVQAVQAAQHPPAWLPAHAKLLFTLDNLDDPQRAQQAIYTHDLPPSRLWPQLHVRLRANGWRPQSEGLVQGGIEHWQQGPHTLMLQVVPVSGGSGMVSVQTGPK